MPYKPQSSNTRPLSASGAKGTNKPLGIFYISTISAYRIRLPYYDTVAVNVLKTVPSISRSYDQATKEWIISEEYFDLVSKTLRAIFTGCEYICVHKSDIPPPPPTPPHAHVYGQTTIIKKEHTPMEEALLGFIKAIPENILPSVFKLVATKLHPDVLTSATSGPTATAMATLNNAWSELKKFLPNA